MNKNPYRFTGPLDPENDKNTCISRAADVNRVISGIVNGNYWAVMGPRHVGKTTFLHQIKHQFPHAHYLYFSFKKPPANEENLYQLLRHRFTKEISSNQTSTGQQESWQIEKPSFIFYDFLKTFRPIKNNQKIILLFDDIDRLPSLENFLRVWRNIYHKRDEMKTLNLKRYALLLSGSVDLIAKTIGPTSPFNIAKTFKITDFSNEESDMLITGPMKQLNISIEPGAKEYLLSLVSGHPQLLQHACHILVKTAQASNKPIGKKDVDQAKKVLFKENQNLKILEDNLENNEPLRKLIQDILKGKKEVYHPHKEFSLWGVGPIVDRDSNCAIRNRLYTEIIKKKSGTFQN